jgi:hypothetical protein
MKGNITITVDFELIERLKREDNYSKLINQLLNDHYALDAFKGMSADELRKRIAIEEKKIELKKELEKLEHE